MIGKKWEEEEEKKRIIVKYCNYKPSLIAGEDKIVHISQFIDGPYT